MSPIPEVVDDIKLNKDLKLSQIKVLKLGHDQIQVNDKVYSAHLLAKDHPGGSLFVKSFAGRDATEAFLSYHRREFPHEHMSFANVGIANPTKKSKHIDDDYLELCRLVDQVLPKNKSFAPFHYYIKCSFILIISFGLEYYMHTTGTYVWYLSGILGFFFASIGLNIQHDANHGSISRYSIVNRLLGMSQNWIGGSAVDWIHQHVVQHHVATNDVHHDPDLAGNNLLRLNPLKKMQNQFLFQHIYVFFLIAMFGFSMVVETFKNIINGHHFTKFPKLTDNNRIFETITSLFFFSRWSILPYYIKPSIWTLINIAPMFIVAGYYLAFFFIISHNFVGVHMFNHDSKSFNESFLYKQVTSSSNVGGSFLAFMNGGLNYQIEHHLFPRISHTHYTKIAPIVKEYCLKKNIPYVHFPTISSNVASCVKHLYTMARNEKTKEYEDNEFNNNKNK